MAPKARKKVLATDPTPLIQAATGQAHTDTHKRVTYN
jgi:hypothetical protein